MLASLAAGGIEVEWNCGMLKTGPVEVTLWSFSNGLICKCVHRKGPSGLKEIVTIGPCM